MENKTANTLKGDPEFNLGRLCALESWYITYFETYQYIHLSLSKVDDHSRGWPEGSLFDSYYTKV